MVKNCVTSEISITTVVAASLSNPARAATETTSATFQRTSAKLYVPVVTLSINDNIKFLKKHEAYIENDNFLEQI